MKFKKKPITIEAVRWTGQNIDEVLALVGWSKMPKEMFIPSLGTLDIPTLEGTMTASPGDWVVRGVKGEVYPCRPDIFEETYERVDD